MADAFEIHGGRAPIAGVYPGADVAMETAVPPLLRRIDVTVLYRIVMDVFDVPGEVGFVTQEVFPKSILPDRLLFFVLATSIWRRA